MIIEPGRLMAFLQRFFLVALILGLPFSALAAEGPSFSESKARAVSLMQSGDHAGAYRIFLDLLREQPDDVDVNIGLARAGKQAGKFNHARLAYERLVETLPENAVLRAEHAHLLLLMGMPEAARLELAEAKRLDPSISESDFGKALQGMEQQVETFKFKGRLAGGIIYDSNMTTGPSLRRVEVGGLDFVLDRRGVKHKSMGTYVHAMADVAWRATADSSWWLVGDVNWYQRWYERTNPSRDLSFGRGAFGLRYLKDSFLAEVRFKTDLLLENDERAVALYGSEGSFIYAARQDLHLLFLGGLEHREDIAARGRSGTYAFGGPHVRYFFGEANHSLMAGVKGYTSATNERRYGFTGVEPGVYLFLNLPRETELTLGAAWHNEDYKGPATLWDGQDRRDSQWRTVAFATKKLTEHLQVEAGWQYTDNRSNSDLYNYDQHIVTVGLALLF